MIEVQLDKEVSYSGEGDFGLSILVEELFSLMTKRGWSELVLKVSPGFTLDSEHRQAIADGDRVRLVPDDVELARASRNAFSLMRAREVRFLAVREVDSDSADRRQLPDIVQQVVQLSLREFGDK